MDVQAHEIEQRDAAIREELRKATSEQAVLRERVKDLEQKAGRPGGGGFETKSWGLSLVESEEFKTLQRSGRGTARIKLETKTTILSSSTGATGMVPQDANLVPVVLPRRELRVRDLLTQSRTVSNAIRFCRLESRSNSAAPQSEGDEKAEQALAFSTDTVPIQTVAAWLPASKQILDDAPQLQSLIDAELTYAVAYAVEQQLLLGDGTGNNLTGLIPASTTFSAPFVPTAVQSLDVLLQARAQLAAANLTATSVVLNPLDFFRMQSLKNVQENYLGSGPFGSGPDRIWGLDVVQSNSMTEDKFLMLAGRAATIYDRQDITIEISTEHADFFTRNLVAVRAECRLALAITQPEGIVYGDMGAVT